MASNPLTATFSDSLLVMTSSRPASMPDEASKPASVIITLWQDETHHWQRWHGRLFGRLHPGKGGTGHVEKCPQCACCISVAMLNEDRLDSPLLVRQPPQGCGGLAWSGRGQRLRL